MINPRPDSASVGSAIEARRADELDQDFRKIRDRLRQHERKLRKEEHEYGSYHDGAGKRYHIGPLYLLMGDIQGALDSFDWFVEEFPDDCGEPGQYLCWFQHPNTTTKLQQIDTISTLYEIFGNR